MVIPGELITRFEGESPLLERTERAPEKLCLGFFLLCGLAFLERHPFGVVTVRKRCVVIL